jgi:tRNA-splicing ligase RtcB
MIAIDHNHVALERHGGRELWVHRKGAISAQRGQPGVLPGSMGSPSFHVEGRGCEEARYSNSWRVLWLTILRGPRRCMVPLRYTF